jgi:hypothetical protein
VNISKRIAGAQPYETFRIALDGLLVPKSPEPVSAR